MSCVFVKGLLSSQLVRLEREDGNLRKWREFGNWVGGTWKRLALLELHKLFQSLWSKGYFKEFSSKRSSWFFFCGWGFWICPVQMDLKIQILWGRDLAMQGSLDVSGAWKTESRRVFQISYYCSWWRRNLSDSQFWFKLFQQVRYHDTQKFRFFRRAFSVPC